MSDAPVRAAQYVRMSTEHRQYSTENQSAVLREYAQKRGIAIVRTFSDSGKSCLRIDGRNALKELIKTVPGLRLCPRPTPYGLRGYLRQSRHCWDEFGRALGTIPGLEKRWRRRFRHGRENRPDSPDARTTWASLGAVTSRRDGSDVGTYLLYRLHRPRTLQNLQAGAARSPSLRIEHESAGRHARTASSSKRSTAAFGGIALDAKSRRSAP